MRIHLRHGKAIRRIAAAGTLIAAAAPVGGAIAAPGGGTPAVSPGYMPKGPVNACFWKDPQINPGRIDQLHQENNFAGPSTDTAYYTTRFQLPRRAPESRCTASTRMRASSPTPPTRTSPA